MPALEIHPDIDELSAFFLGQLDGDRLFIIEDHVAACPAEEMAAGGDLRGGAISEGGRFAAVLTAKTLTIIRLVDLPAPEKPAKAEP